VTITIRTVTALQPGQVIWDESVKGFGCRKQRQRATYILKYRAAGRQRFHTIGPHGSPWTPELARKEARRLLGLVAGGKDPAPAGRDSLGEIATDYLRYAQTKLRPSNFKNVERKLRDCWSPLAGASIYKITRRQVTAQVAVLAQERGPVAAARARSALSAMFNWALREGYELASNPVVGSNRPAERPSRARVLSDDELRKIWQACGDDDYGRIVRLLALTGQRREEVGGLRWSEIDSAAALWTIPAERTKNSRTHTIPLPQFALSLLPPGNGREWVFGIGKRGFQGWSFAKAALDARAQIADWHLHDLRRSCATGMAELGVLPHVVEAVLNHVGSRAGVAGIYNRATYAKEMRAALERWAGHVAVLAGWPGTPARHQ
jgi:integrase